MQSSIPTPPDFSFFQTVSAHGWRRLLPFVWDDNQQALSRAEEMPDGQVVLLNISAHKGSVVVGCDREVDKAAVTARVQRMLQLDLTLHEFHAYCRERPELAQIAHTKQGRLLRSPTLFEDIVKVIATTNTTWKQTMGMVSRIVQSLGAVSSENPDCHAFPTPYRIASVSFEHFAEFARMGYRNRSVYDLATRIADGKLNIEAWQDPTLPADTLRKNLLALPGVGPYAAACLMLYLGKPEQVNCDSWARMLLSRELGRRVTDKEVHAFFAEHGPWRGLVYSFYPWQEQNPIP